MLFGCSKELKAIHNFCQRVCTVSDEEISDATTHCQHCPLGKYRELANRHKKSFTHMFVYCLKRRITKQGRLEVTSSSPEVQAIIDFCRGFCPVRQWELWEHYDRINYCTSSLQCPLVDYALTVEELQQYFHRLFGEHFESEMFESGPDE